VTAPPPPEPTADQPTVTDTAPASGASTTAPAINPRLDDQTDMPGDAAPVPAEPLPPPPRPRWSGIGLWSAAGVTYAAAIGQHVGSHVVIHRRCIGPIDDAGGVDEADVSTANGCYQGGVPGVALQLLGDLSLGASVALSAAGAGTRARRDAYDDRFADRPARDTLKLEIAGASLLGAGVLMFVSTTAATWGAIAGCEDGACVNRLRIVNLSLRNVSGAMSAAGAGMLTYGVLYRRRYFEYGAIYRRGPAGSAALSVVPSLTLPDEGRGVNLTLAGRF